MSAARHRRRLPGMLLGGGTALAASAVLAALGLTFAGPVAAQTAAPAQAQAVAAPAKTATHTEKRACNAAAAGFASCLAFVETSAPQHPQVMLGQAAAPTDDGYGPGSLRSAYNLTSLSSADGSGVTLAVVDAYNDPDIKSDLATYRSDWGLPALAAGQFTVVNEEGETSPLPPNASTNPNSPSYGWDLEESLDLDMVSAICPNCNILLVEASTASFADLGTAVNAAVNLGAVAVSNSYGGGESSQDLTYDTEYYDHPGVAVTASAGDLGYGVDYPAASEYVTSVGGTSLHQSSNSRGWTESVWGTPYAGTGSGCSAADPKPSWQTDTGCSRRTDNDVAADADPATGAAVYDSYSEKGWLQVGGTSESSPIIASVFALAGRPAAGTTPSSYIYQHTSDLYDVTSGADGGCSVTYLCTADTGYDGPTGWGTPDGVAAFTSPSFAPVAAVQGAGGEGLYVNSQAGGSVKLGLGMAAGSSPAITSLPGGSYEIAFDAYGLDSLWVYSPHAGAANTGLGIAGTTSPAITTLTNGSYEVAFHAADGQLWLYSPATGPTDTGLPMVSGTSPAITWLPGGGFTVRYVGTRAALCSYSSPGGSSCSDLGVAPGTSPAVATLSDGTIAYAFRANGGALWLNGAATDLGMASGTSPALAALPGGGYVYAFQANGNALWLNGAATDLGMASGTSPALAALPGGGYVYAFQSSGGILWVGNSSTGLAMASGTSASLAG